MALSRRAAATLLRSSRVVPDDPDDDKLLAAAVAAGVAAVISNDLHLLALDPFGAVRIVQPVDFVAGWLGALQ